MIHYPSTPTDLGDIPYPSNNDVSVFVGGIGTGGSNNNWKVWNKPKGSIMTYMVAIGGGGGGGGGFVSGGDKTGGGGGGSGGIGKLIIPSFFLPDILYILAGDGGQGGASGAAGSAGGISYISLSSTGSLLAQNLILRSSNTAAGGGGAGTGTTGGALGSGASVSDFTVFGITLGIDDNGLVDGQAGAAAPAAGDTAGNPVTCWASRPLSGGASGGSSAGANAAGGAVTAASAINFTYMNWPTTAGAVARAGPAGNNGHANAGVNLWKPFLSSGGAGGGSSDDGAAGSGGNGGIGSGGGGGGATTNNGPRGGNGGPGMVIITSW